MGVPWGIETTSSRWTTKEEFLEKWTSFAAAGLCRRFRIPYDTEVYMFVREDDGTVTVTSRDEPDLIAEIESLSCPDGTYDLFGPLTEAALFVPDHLASRWVPFDKWRHSGGNIVVDSLDALHWMKDEDRPLARELHLAGRFAEDFELVVGISY